METIEERGKLVAELVKLGTGWTALDRMLAKHLDHLRKQFKLAKSAGKKEAAR